MGGYPYSICIWTKTKRQKKKRNAYEEEREKVDERRSKEMKLIIEKSKRNQENFDKKRKLERLPGIQSTNVLMWDSENKLFSYIYNG